jgi:hypothetical protein
MHNSDLHANNHIPTESVSQQDSDTQENGEPITRIVINQTLGTVTIYDTNVTTIPTHVSLSPLNDRTRNLNGLKNNNTGNGTTDLVSSGNKKLVFVDNTSRYGSSSDDRILRESETTFKKKYTSYDDMTKHFNFK